MIKITYREAINRLFENVMQKDERVFLMGEECGKNYGGSIRK